MGSTSESEQFHASVSTASLNGRNGLLNIDDHETEKPDDSILAFTEPDDESRESVGIRRGLRPGCLRCLAGGPKAFAFWIMLYYLLKVSGSLYLGTVIDTIEKQFELSSSESGSLAILNDVMDLALVVFVAYFGQRRHRPRIIGVGAVIAALGFLACAVPHFWLPPYTTAPPGCNDTDQLVDYCSADPKDKAGPCSVDFQKPAVKPVAWLILGQIMVGAGNVPMKPLGTTYVDDAVGKHTTPIYLAFFFIAGTSGSLGGLLLGSLTNSIFVDFDRVAPADRPSFPQTDPRYIGAWWLGFVIIGCAVLLISVPFFFFPRHLPKTRERMKEEEKEQVEERKEEQEEEEEKEMMFEAYKEGGIQMGELSDNPTSREKRSGVPNRLPHQQRFLATLKKMVVSYKKMLTNVPLLLLCLTSAASSAVTAGYAAFALKYFKLQLGIGSAMSAQLGVAVITCIIVGNLLGGLIIRRWKLSPAKCALILIFGEVVGILCMPVFLLVGCSTKAVAGVSTHYAAPAPFDGLGTLTRPVNFPDSVQQAASACNAHCTCENEDYNPVCGVDGITYVSPCYAGCEVVERTRDENDEWVNSFSACRCIRPGGVNATAVDGECPGNCKDWHVPFIISISAIMYFCGSLGHSGLALITLRIVDEDMRATALGFQTLVLNLLGYFPAPVYFGAAINLACILWGYSNGDRGACWLYDNDLYRHSFQGLVGGIKIVSVLVLFGVYFTLRNVKVKKCRDKQSER
ncbi:solute carrier organic anion transporter family member 2A1-like isoform X2 [Patiria miniata]|uniref:Solute carrier organic anion transporter family member n=1 Tax=Patiria miniata TaxID=46514 RepID=A0A913ZU77_PATMI|nr:solute carrier organic anion transporter family member 2A1-like isoform X2 [Patiria miniata]